MEFIDHLRQFGDHSGEVALLAFLQDLLDAADRLRQRLGRPTEGAQLLLRERLHAHRDFIGPENTALMFAIACFLRDQQKGEEPPSPDLRTLMTYLDATWRGDMRHASRLGAILPAIEADPDATRLFMWNIVGSLVPIIKGPRTVFITDTDAPSLIRQGWVELAETDARPDFGASLTSLDGIELCGPAFRAK